MSTALHVHATGAPDGFCGMIGRHPSMLTLFDRIRRAAEQHMPVLIVGETGTGKELVAQALHRLSGVRGTLVALNVAALSEQLADAELFGTVRGAYTGAVDRAGLIEAASGGSLFLDEASDLSGGTQARLLRTLESHTVRRLGGRQEHPIRFRLLVSSQRPAGALVVRGAWRDDFCHRVNGITLRLPPLRERPEDVPFLINHVLRQLGCPTVSLVELRGACSYTWPGNVRELIRVVERAAFAAEGGPVKACHLEAEIGGAAESWSGADPGPADSPRSEERAWIERTLREAGSTKAAAHALGLSTDQLYRRFRALGIRAPRRR